MKKSKKILITLIVLVLLLIIGMLVYMFFFKTDENEVKVIMVKGNHDETFFDNKKEVYLDSNEFFLKLNKINNVYYLDNNSIIFDNIS